MNLNLISLYNYSSPTTLAKQNQTLKSGSTKSRNTRQARAKTNTKNKRTLCPARQPILVGVCICVVFCAECRCVCFCKCVCVLQHWLSMADAVDWRLPATKYRWWWRETRNRTKTRMRMETATRTKAILICIPDACCNASAAWNTNESRTAQPPPPNPPRCLIPYCSLSYLPSFYAVGNLKRWAHPLSISGVFLFFSYTCLPGLSALISRNQSGPGRSYLNFCVFQSEHFYRG